VDRVDALVVGAGVVGLAIARALGRAGFETVVVEKSGLIGSETSSRNSEVIHAGIYYAIGSLKARYCVAGKEILYRYCAEHGVAHRRCGKIIVATAENQVQAMHDIKQRAADCGVGDLEMLTAADAIAMEPALSCHAALFSPSTGIIDTHGLMLELQGDAEAAGAMMAFLSPVSSGAARDDGILLNVGGETAMALLCRSVVNCAGLYATDIASAIDGMPQDLVPNTY